MNELIQQARELDVHASTTEFLLGVRPTLRQLCDALEAAQKEIERLNDEPPAYRFYYCDSEDSYLLGRRMDTMYYAHWYDGSGFVWDMSRYLPWGETIDGHERGCAWGVHTYPSEPREIGAEEWFSGFLKQRMAGVTARAEKAEAERDTYKKALSRLEHMISVERDGNKKREHSIGVEVAIKRAREVLEGELA